MYINNILQFLSFSVWLTSLKIYILSSVQFSSVQFSRSVMSDSLWPHELQHTRPPCPSPTTGVHSNSCPSSQWCHPAISSSVVPFSSCPASESFPMSQLFAWGGQSTRVSALASFLLKKSQGWSHRCMDLSLGFLFCSVDLYFCLCAGTILSWWL